MNLDRTTYKRYAEARAPRSKLLTNMLKAFAVGGGICALAESIRTVLFAWFSLPEKTAGTVTSVTLVGIAVLLTALGRFDKIAKHAGAGTLVPITGFANAVASPAIDSRAEGIVLGIGEKIFSVAGPVLLYGTLAGAVYGVLYFLAGVLF